MSSAIVAGVSTNAYTYDPETLALSMETQNGMEINRTTDLPAPQSPATRQAGALGRDTGFSLAGADYGVTYAYDAYGRFQSVTSARSMRPRSGKSEDTFTYSYLPDSDLISGMTASCGFLWTRAYESGRSLITSVENRIGETVISRYDYANDELGRRTSRADSGLAFANPAFDKYAYNGRSEVTGAQRYHGTDVSDTSTVYGGRQFGYAYDPIGNRTSASETIGGETLAKAYTANALNQYTAIANPNAVGLRGDATNTAVVTVNGQTVQNDAVAANRVPWHFALEADNVNGPDFPLAEITAVINPPGTNTPDIVSTSSGHLYAPPQNETLTYDLDGNLTSDGRWQYTWNGENRLIKAEELIAPTNRQPYTVEYTYDHQGRMVWKEISRRGAEAQSWEVERTASILWDGYNIVQTLMHSQTHTLTNCYTWGLDLSGTLQGAGGVGGLLAEIKDGTPYFAAFDANGNVTEYIATNGMIEAHYEYSPFGEIVVQSGDMADSFTHRFSTKPWCAVTGLSEYLFRKYSPGMDRWLNRDPIGENGGMDLYGFTGNNAVSRIEALGLFIGGCARSKPCCCCCVEDLDVDQKLIYKAPKRPGWPFKLPGWVSGRYEYDIKVIAKIEYKAIEKPVNDSGCKLKWVETNHDDSTGILNGPTKGLLPGQSETVDTFDGWKHCVKCPGKVTLKMLTPHGFPVIKPPHTRTSHITSDVTIYSASAPECQKVCAHPEMRVKVETKLKVVGGFPDLAFEDIIIEYWPPKTP